MRTRTVRVGSSAADASGEEDANVVPSTNIRKLMAVRTSAASRAATARMLQARPRHRLFAAMFEARNGSMDGGASESESVKSHQKWLASAGHFATSKTTHLRLQPQHAP